MNFEQECMVCIMAITKDNRKVVIQYPRPQRAPDGPLTYEALQAFEEMRAEGVQNVDRLVAVFIARNQEQYDEFMRDKEMMPQED